MAARILSKLPIRLWRAPVDFFGVGIAPPPRVQEHSMKVGFLATSVAMFSFGGMVSAQPLASGNPFRKPAPPLLVDCVQLGRPRPLREVPKAAAPLTVGSHMQT